MNRRARQPALLLVAALAIGVAARPDGPAHAQVTCPPPSVAASQGTECHAIQVAWSGTRIGTSWQVYRATRSNGADAVLLGSTTLTHITDNTVQDGIHYYYFVRQFGGICGTNSPPSPGAEGFTGTLDAPSSIVATEGPSCSQVDVSWSAREGAESYDVARSLYADARDRFVLANTTQTSYVDATAAPLTRYYYWVRARSVGACLGPFQANGVRGSLNMPPLPDLVLDPGMLDIKQFNVMPPAGPGWEYQIRAGIVNVGTAPFQLFAAIDANDDGSRNFTQRHLSCTSSLVDRPLGAFATSTDVDAVTIPHFLRVRVRDRVAGDVPGAIRAQVDLAARCVRDDSLEHAELPGAPLAPVFTACGSFAPGISVGWKLAYLSYVPGHQLDLRCVGPGDYFIEEEVDPEHMFVELDETNNVVLSEVSLDFIPTPAFPPCSFPALQATLIGPDSLVSGAGAPTDSITASVWLANVTEAPGAQTILQAEFGYAPFDLFNAPGVRAGDVALDDPFTWIPATFLRQDGPADVYGTTFQIVEPNVYVYAFRVHDLDGRLVYADLDGSLNGWSEFKSGILRVAATTGVGDAPSNEPLALSAITSPWGGRGTRFRLGLPQATQVTLALYDARGRRVRALERGPRSPGVHWIDWDGRDDAGRAAASGIYFARLDTAMGARLTTKFFAEAR